MQIEQRPVHCESAWATHFLQIIKKCHAHHMMLTEVFYLPLVFLDVLPPALRLADQGAILYCDWLKLGSLKLRWTISQLQRREAAPVRIQVVKIPAWNFPLNVSHVNCWHGERIDSKVRTKVVTPPFKCSVCLMFKFLDFETQLNYLVSLWRSSHGYGTINPGYVASAGKSPL